MSDELFIVALAISFGTLLVWAFKTLPRENWQILASIPVAKVDSDNWTGVNLTYYGLFTALATVTAVSVLFVLTAAIGVPKKVSFAVVGIIFCLGLPAAKMIARLVERRPQTFTIAGASFFGFVASPWIVWALGARPELLVDQVPVIPVLTAIVISYALGEGLGRLACISFGCCYGKPLAECRPWLRRVIGPHAFIFSGKSKKIAYERGLDGESVVPVQALTSVLHVAVALFGILLYLKSWYSAAFVATVAVTQTWRVASEFLRADHRGGGRLSAYQIMAMTALVYGLLMLLIFGGESLPVADLGTGLVSLWDPAVLFFVQVVGLATFLYTGLSKVTSSTMSFHVIKDRV